MQGGGFEGLALGHGDEDSIPSVFSRKLLSCKSSQSFKTQCLIKRLKYCMMNMNDKLTLSENCGLGIPSARDLNNGVT